MAPVSPESALTDLLLSLFSADELRRFLRYGPDGAAVSASLPGATASAAEVASRAVEVLAARGLIADSLFDRLLSERARRLPDIEAVRERWHGSASGDPGPSRAVTRILFLAANPLGTSPLNLGREMREIEDRLRLAGVRDRFEIVLAPDVRVQDLARRLLQHAPHIVHFGGHGLDGGGLMMEGPDGATLSVPPEGLADLLSQFSETLRCVVLNACFSAAQAAGIRQSIDCVVGMSSAFRDAAAVTFATAFYQGLAHGRSVDGAFRLGRAELRMTEPTMAEVPRLLAREGVDPTTLTFV